jgi:hypothetical protein
MNKKQFLEDFEYKRKMAELKVLSAISLERPLDNGEYNRMMVLAKELGLK